MKSIFYISLAVLVFALTGCSTKKNNFFTRQYHRLTTRYNVYFNGDEALKGGVKKMEQNHKEDYTNLLPVFVSNNEQTRAIGGSDMDYAIEKAVKAIDKHSITAKPKRRRNKNSKNYETFRKKKEFNDQIAKCYLLLGKAYFYKEKYNMAGNTFRYIQRQYPEDKALMTEVDLWMFRNLTEMGRYDEAVQYLASLEGAKLKRRQREMYAAARTDFYVRQAQYPQAIREAENLLGVCKSMKRKPRYNFMLSQLYLKENQDAQAMAALKKAVRFNFNYEMVFNAKINMALAYQAGDESVKKKLNKMLKDSRNEEYQDRIYYALANIEEKKGNEEAAIDLYWKSVKSSIDNDNQKSLSFLKLGGYYYKERQYVPAQSCYDSCMYFMDSRIEGYEQLKTLVGDLTELVTNLNTIQRQDSLQRLAALSDAERNNIIDGIIQDIKDEEKRQKEIEQQAMLERNFFQRNDMLSRGNTYNQSSSGSGGDWYFYNPMTISLGKNDFKRKWGRRKLEDNWRRQNKAMVDFTEESEVLAEEGEGTVKKADITSRDYYLEDIPLTEEQMTASNKKIEDAYYKAGEVYLYKFNDPEKALDCFTAFISRFPESGNITLVYYLAYEAAGKAGKASQAETLKDELIRKFPDSDYAKGLQDPEYFKKVDSDLRTVDRMYAEAYELYQNVYYKEALARCEDILQQFPGSKMSSYVLFLRAMCIVNLQPADEARIALNEVLAAKPTKRIQTVVNGILASMDVGDKPVLYADAEMYDARYLKSVRNWTFDKEKNAENTEEDRENPYKVNKEEEYCVVILLPEDMKTMQVLHLQTRLTFLNAALKAEQKDEKGDYQVKKEDLWYKTTALQIEPFANYGEAAVYLNRVAVDKTLLKNFKGARYRIFAISKTNFSVLKRLKNAEQYVDFFVTNYFDDRGQGEIITGRQGAAAHLFKYEADEKHDFVLMVPYRQVNVKKMAELLHGIEPAFALEKETYDDRYEMVVVKNVGTQVQSMEYLQLVSRNKEIFDRLSGTSSYMFTITQSNLGILLENQNIEEYMKFFDDNYQRNQSGEVGVGDGDFVYAKSVAHKFVLFYPNTIDPFKLKTTFEEFNFAGLMVNNVKYDDEHDCMVVSGFRNKEEAMRYFQTAVDNRKLFRSLRNVDYRNFIISDSNFDTMCEKKEIEQYLQFFKKYYLE